VRSGLVVKLSCGEAGTWDPTPHIPISTHNAGIGKKVDP
jgi:hypothetical protein